MFEFLTRLFRRKAKQPPSRLEPPTHGPIPMQHDAPLGHDLELAPDDSWDDVDLESAASIDPNLRLVVSLLETQDLDQLFLRTGIRVSADNKLSNQRLPLFLELDREHGPFAQTFDALRAYLEEKGLDLQIPRAFYNEASRNPQLRHVTADLALDDADLSASNNYAATLRGKLAQLMNAPGILRVSVPVPLQPCLVDSLQDIDLPTNRQFRNKIVNGKGVVVGIIDDGCALAHRNFLIPGTIQSRIQYLWDQSRTTITGDWKIPLGPDGLQDFDGLELDNAAINAAVKKAGMFAGTILEEDKVYDLLNYPIDDLASHGTHVMDIAAGNGKALLGTEGVASGADIIFVQLPKGAIDVGGPILESHILKGVAYVFARAAALGAERASPGAVPAVVNISYGGYSGPHDGTTPLASGIDDWLNLQYDRSVVVSAGNGFEADCHATQGPLAVNATSTPLRWIVRPMDPTSNVMEIWYDGNAGLDLRLTPPGAAGPLQPPVGLGGNLIIRRRVDGRIVGWINHLATNWGNHLNCIRIVLLPTLGEDSAPLASVSVPPIPLFGPSPSGEWNIALKNVGTVPVTFHAWIERDDLGRTGRAGRQQSHFAPDDAEPSCTLAGLATGVHAICVGGYNTATSEVCRYSACGPTRDGRLDKPDVCAPAEEDVAGRGILCASSRKSNATRLNGTSAAAPHVTGLVALMFQFNRDIGGAALTANDVRTKVVAAATAAQALAPPPPHDLRANRHNLADAARPAGKKQSDVLGRLTGGGKIDVFKTLGLL